MANITANDGNYTRSAASGDGLYVFLAALNIFLSITASLSNAVILIALHKVTSIYPPTKLLFRCLAVTDLCVGLISQPLFTLTFLDIMWDGNVMFHIFDASTIVLAAVSVLTSTAISVDRLVALMMGLRYRHVVTLRRVRAIVIFVWIISCALAAGTQFWVAVDKFQPISFNVFMVLIILCILTSIISYTKIYLQLRHQQIHLQENLQQQGQAPNRGENPLNIARYKKTVSSIAWVQLALLVCYLPFSVSHIIWFQDVLNPNLAIASDLTFSFLFLNSSLNPVLYCWKIKDVRQAVKNTIKFSCCGSS